MSIIEKRGERLIAGKPPSQLVDVEHGKISREIFVSEELFDLELEYPPLQGNRGSRA